MKKWDALTKKKEGEMTERENKLKSSEEKGGGTIKNDKKSWQKSWKIGTKQLKLWNRKIKELKTRIGYQSRDLEMLTWKSEALSSKLELAKLEDDKWSYKASLEEANGGIWLKRMGEG